MVEMADSVTGSSDDWNTFCKTSVSKIEFSKFRQNLILKQVVEGTPKYAGRDLLARVKKKSSKALIQKFATSESIGDPTDTIRYSLRDSNTRISPTTLRYANNLNLLIELFGSNNFENVYEIGGGYGGEAKIVFDYFNFYDLPAPTYSIFDLDTSFPLIQLFLSKFQYQINKEDIFSFKHTIKNSLLISNGAFSEMRRDLQDLYFEKVVSRCRFGYFITNFESHSVPYNGWSTDEFVERLRLAGKYDVQILQAGKYLSWYDEKANSKLIIFGQINKPTTLKFSALVHQIYCFAYHNQYRVNQKINSILNFAKQV